MEFIEPDPMLATIKIPDGTPSIVKKYSVSDEQALLTIVRYNRLIDTFLGITCYSLQNHLRTTVDGSVKLKRMSCMLAWIKKAVSSLYQYRQRVVPTNWVLRRSNRIWSYAGKNILN